MFEAVEVDNSGTLICPCGGSPFVFKVNRRPDPYYRAKCYRCGCSSRPGDTPQEALRGWDLDTEADLRGSDLPLQRKQAPIPSAAQLDNQVIKVLDQVTNAEYQKFRPEHLVPAGQENKPVTQVSFRDGMEYARWLSQTTGRKIRLITEEERVVAEATFVADFSQCPLSEIPDVGTFGKNADGVTGLLGVTYDWCADREDLLDPVALGWATEVAVTFTLPSTPKDILRELRENLNLRIQKAEAARQLKDAGKHRMVRGSFWDEKRTKANRGGEEIAFGDPYTGIRLVEVIAWR